MVIPTNFAPSKSGAAEMAINPANMEECDPKCVCSYGPNANVAYSCNDPCAGGTLGEFNSGACDCEETGPCYGGIATYVTCDGNSFCFRSTSIKCEEALGGCPTLIGQSDTSIYGCEFEDPNNFTLQTFWQYPDGSLVTVSLASGFNTKIQPNPSITPLYRVECFSGPC